MADAQCSQNTLSSHAVSAAIDRPRFVQKVVFAYAHNFDKPAEALLEYCKAADGPNAGLHPAVTGSAESSAPPRHPGSFPVIAPTSGVGAPETASSQRATSASDSTHCKLAEPLAAAQSSAHGQAVTLRLCAADVLHEVQYQWLPPAEQHSAPGDDQDIGTSALNVYMTEEHVECARLMLRAGAALAVSQYLKLHCAATVFTLEHNVRGALYTQGYIGDAIQHCIHARLGMGSEGV